MGTLKHPFQNGRRRHLSQIALTHRLQLKNHVKNLIFLPRNEPLLFGKVKSVSLLGFKEEIQWKQTNDGLMITAPRDYNGSYALTFKIIPK